LANATLERIEQRIPKELRPHRSDGRLPQVRRFEQSTDEARFVADEIAKLLKNGIPGREIAVLYRVHHLSDELQMELARRGIPCDVRSGTRFVERSHVKDVVAHLRAAFLPDDRLAWQRLLRTLPGVGPVGAGKFLSAMRAAPDPLTFAFSSAATAVLPKKARQEWLAIVRRLAAARNLLLVNDIVGAVTSVRRGGYDAAISARSADANARLLELDQLTRFAGGYSSAESFLADLSLTGRDAESTSQRVVLTSVHQSKGLEWDYLFVIGLGDGVFPLSRAVAEPGGENEERRLFYVAITRARERLYLSYSRSWRNSSWQASRFLKEFSTSLYERVMTQDEARSTVGYLRQDRQPWKMIPSNRPNYSSSRVGSVRPKNVFAETMRKTEQPRPAGKRLNLQVGERVRHAIFGLGTVSATNEARDGSRDLRVRFDAVGEKLLLEHVAPLERIL
jgi:DNA helicase-2/ATP-dependent DNA helicase PcrA